jgi:glycosyltransferase involved in cell wall biosynthesis
MEVKSPKVSVILPCYNVEKYIAKSIQSVLDQVFIDFELLVIIDGSPDNSKQIAETFSDARISIYEKPNGGLSDARNYGLERAQGEFIYFIDSDDWIDSKLLRDSVAILEDELLDVVIFGYTQDDEDHEGKVIRSTEICPELNFYLKKNGDFIPDAKLLGILGYAWNKIYRKAFLIQNGICFEKGTSLIEDILFNTQVYIETEKLMFVNKSYYHYMNRPIGTLIKQFHFSSFELKKRRAKEVEKFLSDWKVPTLLSNLLLADILIKGIRYSIHNMYSYDNNLTFRNKRDFINKMINDKMVREFISFYKSETFVDKVYLHLIKYKQHVVIASMASIIK